MHKLASLLCLLSAIFVSFVRAEAWTSAKATSSSTSTRLASAMKSTAFSGGGSQSPPPPTLKALYRSVQSGDNHMVVKVVYDSSSDNKMPVVLYFNGANCPHESYMWLAERLARAGCCVVLSSCVCSFGSMTGLLSLPFNLTMLDSLEDYKRGPSRDSIADILECLSSLDKEDNEMSSPLSGRLDLDRIVVGGHSSGGRTVLDLVSFDNPFPIVAAFTYGASLVVTTGGLGFAAKGMIVPCDTTKTPPPLLILGGSEDGISATLSVTGKDATETLRRTMTEAFEGAKGDADLLILEGANHMVFCHPNDPTAGANAADWPLKQVNGEQVRTVLGNVILDFLSSHGLPNAGSKKRGNAAFRTNIPSSMLHSLKSYRPKSSSTPKMSVVDEREHQEAVWDVISSALEKCISETISELGLEPSTKLSDTARQWTTGNLTGSLDAWESSNVVWAVKYGNSNNDDAKSLGFNVWLAEKSDAPHLTMYVGVRGNRATFMADCLPRFDLATNPQYIQQYYGGNHAQEWQRLQNTDKVHFFSSMDPTIRAVQSPNALALSIEITDDADLVDILVSALKSHFRSWMDFVANANQLSKEDAEEVAKRDLQVRRVLCRHERLAGERFFANNKDLASSLANNMAGFFETTE